MSFKIAALKAVLRTVALFKGEKYKYSQEYEDNFKYMDIGEKLWWGYKSLIRQSERAEKGKGIEEYFKSQDLDFTPGDSFICESKVTITAAGDLSMADVVTPESTVHLWDDIKDFYFSGDIACANLECPLDASKPPSGVPSMCLTAPDLNTSPDMFERFTMGGKGVNFFSTANNHSLDMGEEGLVATLNFLDSKGYMHVGTSRTLNEQSDIPVIEKNGIRIGFISYTYCLNGKDPIPGKEYMTNVLRLNKPDTDISIIKQHVQAARGKNADIVAAILHWSIEFETYPIENIIKMGHRIMDECGVDIILGGHPHVAQPMEKYLFKDPFTGHQKEGFIVYSLGECVSYNAFSRNSRLALTLKLDIEKGMDSGLPSTRVTGLKALPIYTWIHALEDGRYDYRLLNFIKTVEQLKNGQNPYGFSEKQISEFMRLNSLLNDRLLPGKKDNILN